MRMLPCLTCVVTTGTAGRLAGASAALPLAPAAGFPAALPLVPGFSAALLPGAAPCSLWVTLSYVVTTPWGRYVRHAATSPLCMRYEPATASRASTRSQSHQRRLLRGLATVS